MCWKGDRILRNSDIHLDYFRKIKFQKLYVFVFKMKNFMLNISKYELCSAKKSMFEISKIIIFCSLLSVICIHLKITLLNASKKPARAKHVLAIKFVLSFFSMAINLTLMITAGSTKMWKRKTTFRNFCMDLLIHNDTFIWSSLSWIWMFLILKTIYFHLWFLF